MNEEHPMFAVSGDGENVDDRTVKEPAMNWIGQIPSFVSQALREDSSQSFSKIWEAYIEQNPPSDLPGSMADNQSTVAAGIETARGLYESIKRH